MVPGPFKPLRNAMRTISPIKVAVWVGLLACAGCAHHKVKAPPPAPPPVVLPAEVAAVAEHLEGCLHRAAFAVTDTVHASADFAPGIRDYCAADVRALAEVSAAQTHDSAAAQILFWNALEQSRARAAHALDETRAHELPRR